MQSELTDSFYRWVHELPSSRMVFPETFWQRAKYMFWRFYTPYHPLVRDTALALGIVHHAGRQHYLIGRIAPEHTLQGVIAFLISQGFANHFIAWKDDGEVVSLRFVADFSHQYHIRLFIDGEVRAHYEYTPECRPIYHLTEVGQESRREFFTDLLKGIIIELAGE